MKKIFKIILVVFVIVIVLIILSISILTLVKSPRCFLSCGIWWNFPNGCVDSCSFVRGETVACTQAFTEGCNCGPFRCWNHEKQRCKLN